VFTYQVLLGSGQIRTSTPLSSQFRSTSYCCRTGQLTQRREFSGLGTLNDPSIAGNRGRSVILGDLAAVEAAQRNPEAACGYAIQALDQLGTCWYATGMDRVLEVRKALQPSAELDCVQRLDDRLYDWQATLRTLQR
jgi:hypothetical protein